MQNSLSHEVVALIHHIELNKAGWWDKAIQQLIAATLWAGTEALAPDEIAMAIGKEFKIHVGVPQVARQLSALTAEKEVIQVAGDRFRLTEAARARLTSASSASRDSEERVAAFFSKTLAEHCPGLAGSVDWGTFDAQLLRPLVRELGAYTYELMAGRKPDLDETTRLPDFLSAYPEEQRPGLKQAILCFLDHSNHDVRGFVLRRLSASFLIEAAGLDGRTLDILRHTTPGAISFKVFLDTNFLFSVLGLHENPSNEAAQLLTKLASQVGEGVSVRLYVLPPTIEEARKVLAAARDNLTGLRLTQNTADAASLMRLSGVVQKFVDEARRSRRAISAEAYFDPYIEGLVQVARGKGVELYNEKLDRYRTDPRVTDDILNRMEFEADMPRRKTYEQLEHDRILWHYIDDKRAASVNSLTDAVYWIATVDYRFLGFDAYKTRILSRRVQCCVHPTSLIQILQFWLPRTPLFEEAILNSLKLPFMFHDFDFETERSTVRILKTLGRYESIQDLSRETILSILMDETLRQRISTSDNAEGDAELIRETLVEVQARTEEQRDALSSRTRELEKMTEAATQEVAELNSRLQATTVETRTAQEQANAAYARANAMEERVSLLERELESRETAIEGLKQAQLRARTRGAFTVRHVVVPAIVAVFPSYVLFLLLTRLDKLQPWEQHVMPIVFFFLGTAFYIWLAGRKSAEAGDWPAMRRFLSVAKWTAAVLLAIAIGILSNTTGGWLSGLLSRFRAQ
jgi:hypothetical protein